MSFFLSTRGASPNQINQMFVCDCKEFSRCYKIKHCHWLNFRLNFPFSFPFPYNSIMCVENVI